MRKPTWRTTNMFAKHSTLAMAIAVFGTNLSSARADQLPCDAPGKLVSISGKIFGNALGPGETLGTVHAVIGQEKKIKCGIHGRAYFNQDGSFGGFIHNFVCDDQAQAPNSIDAIHSQITLNTRFDGVPAFQSCGIPVIDLNYGSFREISDPQAGRGIFAPGGGGRIFIQGTLNCAGAVDMSFSGNVCLVQ